jgi:hypothetical protein
MHHSDTVSSARPVITVETGSPSSSSSQNLMRSMPSSAVRGGVVYELPADLRDGGVGGAAAVGAEACIGRGYGAFFVPLLRIWRRYAAKNALSAYLTSPEPCPAERRAIIGLIPRLQSSRRYLSWS